MKRREPLNLAHVLEDRSPSAIPVPIIEKRIHTRFDKAFLVLIGSELYGDTVAVARNISTGGILVEMSYAPPLGTVVTVHFQHVRYDDPLERDEPGVRGCDGSAGGAGAGRESPLSIHEPRDATRGGGNGPTLPGQRGRESPQLITELVVRAEVKHHHYLNFTGGNDAASARAIGLRFLEFIDPDERIPPDRWH